MSMVIENIAIANAIIGILCASFGMAFGTVLCIITYTKMCNGYQAQIDKRQKQLNLALESVEFYKNMHALNALTYTHEEI